MIDFKQAKSQLIPILQMYGFSEKLDKSCKKYKVYSDGSDVLVLKLGVNGQYEHYQSKTDSTDYGDTIQFLLKRNIPSYCRGAKIGRQECLILERELNKVSNITVDMASDGNSREKASVFNIADYNVLPIENDKPLPSSVKTLLFQRRITENLSQSDFQNSIALLKSDKGFSTLLFLWRDEYDVVCGAQYKYMKEKVCVKRFLKNTNRDGALWRTSIQGKTAIFVTEDPLDAIAHKQLYPDLKYAYVCSGGSMTVKQAIIIRKLATDHALPIILGCDNDIAGQITNYKVCDPAVAVVHDKTNASVSIINDGVETSIPEENFTRFVRVEAAKKGMQIALPETPYKDWNDYLLPKSKSSLLQAISEKVAKEISNKKDFYGLTL